MKKTSHKGIPLLSSRLTATISVSLVLLLLGVAGMLGLAANNIANDIRSSMGFVVIMADDVSSVDSGALRQRLAKAPYTASVNFTSADEVMKRWQNMVGTADNLSELLDANPFAPEIEVNVKPQWAITDSLETIKAILETNPAVDEVKIQTAVVNDINSAVTRIALVLIIVAATLLTISFVLINNTVRLTIYARRFTIHTMKLVGATPGFIRAPIIKSNIAAGLVAGLIADALLAGALYYGMNVEPDLETLIGWTDTAWVMAALPLIGIIVCMLAAFGAANRYIKVSYDRLFK